MPKWGIHFQLKPAELPNNQVEDIRVFAALFGAEERRVETESFTILYYITDCENAFEQLQTFSLHVFADQISEI